MTSPDPMDPHEQQRRFTRNMIIVLVMIVIAGFVFFAASSCAKPEARYSGTPTRVVVADSVLYQFVAIPAPARVDTIKVCYDVVMAVVECPVTPPPIDTTTPPPSAPATPGKPTFSSSAGGTNATVTVVWAAAARAAGYNYHAGRDAGPAWGGTSGTTAVTTVAMTSVPRSVQLFFCVKAVNSAGASTDACASYTVPASTTPPTDTTTPPPTGSHEPSGMTVLTERGWNALGEGGWYDQLEDPNLATKYRITQDASAAKSPANVGMQIFPVGFPLNGSSPAVAEKGIGKKGVVYVSFWVKLSSNWVGHPTGVLKTLHFWTGGSNKLIPEITGQGSSELTPTIAIQNTITSGSKLYMPNLVPTARFSRGAWHHMEYVMTGNSSGMANGRVEWWQDGVKVGDIGSLQFNSGAATWEILQVNPTYGGSEPGTLRTEQFIYFDHLYVSGK